MAAEETKPAAAKTVVVKSSVPAVTPFGFREMKLREGMVTRLKEFKPDGNPDPKQLEHARTFALAEVAALPDDVNAVEVSIEAHIGPGARQTNIIVWPKKI